MEYLLPLLEGLGGSSAGLSGNAGLLNALGGGDVLGTLAGTPMAGGMQGPTQGSGLFGALSGGGMNALLGSKKKPEYRPYLGAEDGVSPQYQFSQNRFRPINY